MRIICVKQPVNLKSMYFQPVINDSQYRRDFHKFFSTYSSDLMLFQPFKLSLTMIDDFS